MSLLTVNALVTISCTAVIQSEIRLVRQKNTMSKTLLVRKVVGESELWEVDCYT